MTTLFGWYMGRHIRRTGILLLCACAALLFAERQQVQPPFAIFILVISPWMIAPMALVWMDHAWAASWIPLLPLSKRSILLSRALAMLTVPPLCFIGAALTFWFGWKFCPSWARMGDRLFQEFQPALDLIPSDHGAMGSGFDGVVLGRSILVSAVLYVSFAMVWPVAAVGQIRNADPRKRKLAILQFSGAVAAILLLESAPRWITGTPFEAPILYQSLIFGVLPLTVLISGVSLGFPKPVLWRWVRTSGILAISCVVSLLASDWMRLRSEDPKKWVEAVMHLGALSGKWDKVSFESVLKVDLPPDQLAEIFSDYRRRFFEESLIDPSDPRAPSFVEVLRGRSRGESLLVVAAQYRMSGLSPDQVIAYAAEVTARKRDSSLAQPLWRAVGAAWLDERRLLEFFQSADPILQEFALRRIALDREPAWLSRLQDRLSVLGDSNRRHALTVIGLLSGRRFALSDWTMAVSAKDLTYLHVECEKFSAIEASALRIEDEAPVNICVRQKLRRGESALEWIELPLSSDGVRRYRKLFGKK